MAPARGQKDSSRRRWKVEIDGDGYIRIFSPYSSTVSSTEY